MSNNSAHNRLCFGSEDLRLPDALREPILAHLEDLRTKYQKRHWGGLTGFGEHPALVVIDLAKCWVDPKEAMGSNIESIVESTCRLLKSARDADIPIFFTSFESDLMDSHPKKFKGNIPVVAGDRLDLDPRLGRRSTEPLLLKRYASAFKGTRFLQMLASLRVDTLIVTGVSTSHCVYATCRDAVESFRVIVPKEAVGERCEIMHRVNLLDIEIDLGDVVLEAEVIQYLKGLKVE